MYTRDKEYYSYLPLDKATALAAKLREDDDEWVYEVVPTPRVGLYAIAVIDEGMELLGYL